MCLNKTCPVCGANYVPFGAAVAKHARCRLISGKHGGVSAPPADGTWQLPEKGERVLPSSSAPFSVSDGKVHFPFEPIGIVNQKGDWTVTPDGKIPSWLIK